MTKPPEVARSTIATQDRRTAFGLSLSIDPRIAIPGLGHAISPLYEEPPTCVRLDEGEIQRRWSSLAGEPLRARELSLGDEILLTVDFVASEGYLLWAKDFGRVLISPDGDELICEPDETNDAWASIIPAQALPLAATIRGLEVFHASGVVFDGRALLFAGPPGAGKSSLAAAFVRADAQLLSDDAVALQLRCGQLFAHAGSMVLQLRAGEDERLSEQARESLGEPTDSPFDKQRYLSGDTPAPARLGGVFLLERSADQPAVERLELVNPFDLIASTFNLSVRTENRLRNQLDIVSAIASGGVAHRLRVQPNVDATELASIVRDVLSREISGGAAVPPERDPREQES